MKRKRLGEVLFERGHISSVDLTKALQDQQGKFVHLGELLMARGLVNKQDLTAALSEVSTVPYLDCTQLEIVQSVLRLVPPALARKCLAIPVEVTGNTLTIIMAEPQNIQLIDELRFQSGLKISPRFGFRGGARRNRTSICRVGRATRPSPGRRRHHWHGIHFRQHPAA